MKKVKIEKTIKPFIAKFSVQKNIRFSNQKKIANILSRAFKEFKPLKF